MKRKVLGLFVVLFAMMLMMPMAAASNGEVKTGTDGGIRWTYYENNRTLVLDPDGSGVGENHYSIKNYANGGNYSRYDGGLAGYGELPIDTLVIHDGVHDLGDGSFHGRTEHPIRELIGEENLKRIGNSTFYGSLILDEIDLSGVEEVCDWGLAYCDISNIKLGVSTKLESGLALAKS